MVFGCFWLILQKWQSSWKITRNAREISAPVAGKFVQAKVYCQKKYKKEK